MKTDMGNGIVWELRDEDGDPGVWITFSERKTPDMWHVEFTDERPRDRERVQQQAQLIVAAPGLLATARDVLALFSTPIAPHNSPSDFARQLKFTLGALRCAIEKAEGRS